jgi:hypothetical protein
VLQCLRHRPGSPISSPRLAARSGACALTALYAPRRWLGTRTPLAAGAIPAPTRGRYLPTLHPAPSLFTMLRPQSPPYGRARLRRGWWLLIPQAQDSHTLPPRRRRARQTACRRMRLRRTLAQLALPHKWRHSRRWPLRRRVMP